MIVSKEKIRDIFDYLFISFFVFGCFLGNKGAIPFVVFGLCPLFVHFRELSSRRIWMLPLIVSVIFVAYFAYGLMALYFFRGLGPGERSPVNPDAELYGVAILLAFLGLMRGAIIEDLFQKFKFVLPWALLVTFLVLSGYAVLNISGDGRVQAETPWPFIPALIFTTWSFLSLLGWGTLTKRQRWSRLGLLSLSVLVVNGYTGSRGVGVAQFAVILAFWGAGFARKFRGRLPSRRELVVATVIGLSLLGVQQMINGYGALLRLEYISQLTVRIFSGGQETSPTASPPSSNSSPASPPVLPAQPAKEAQSSDDKAPAAAEPDVAPSADTQPSLSSISPDASISVRLAMWSVSLKSFLEAPLLGHGSMSMKPIIQDRFGLQHNHNQYLTWMVTGGAVLLLLGLAFLSLPYFISAGLEESDRLVMVLSVSVFWGFAMLFDSFFSLKFYLHYYCLLLGVLMAMVQKMPKQNGASGPDFDRDI